MIIFYIENYMICWIILVFNKNLSKKSIEIDKRNKILELYNL